MEIKSEKKSNHLFRIYRLLPNLIVFFNLIKIYKLSCSIDTPFSKNDTCMDFCTTKEIDNEECLIDNIKVKTQFINKVVHISSTLFEYMNIVTSSNGDLIILISSYKDLTKRIIYAMTKEGRGYFIIDGEESKIYTFQITQLQLYRFESEIFMVKLSSNPQKEYLLSFGHTRDTTELYDLENKSIRINFYETDFYKIYSIHQISGAYTALNSNYYIIGLLGKEYDTSGAEKRNILCLIKFQVSLRNNNLILNFYNSNNFVNSQNKKEITIGYCNSVSCYTISTNYIICFFKSKNNKYTMQAFSDSLQEKRSLSLADANQNEFIYYKCIHFFGDIGAFIYFNNEPIYPIIEFKRYNSDNTINSYLYKINLNDYSFFYNITGNDFIKVSDKRIIYITLSLSKDYLYIILINNYIAEKLTLRIYKNNNLLCHEYYFATTIRLAIYNNFVAMALNGYTIDSQTLSSLIMFSYPNSTDVKNELSKYLFDNNEIKIDNISLELRNLCNMENNIFGFKLTGLEILEIDKSSNEYLYEPNNNEEIIQGSLTLDNCLKLKIEKVNNIYNTFSYGIKYTCLATEPEYDEYNDYTIYFNNTDKTIFDSYKKTYYGRYSYYYFTLDYKLTDEGCDQLCELCYYTENNKCVTCSSGFKYTNDKKICNEEMTIILETTIPELIETTIPELIETTIPELIETTIPEIIETTIPELIETTISEIIETTIPEIFETTIPEKIETTITELIETTIPEIIESTIPEIIETTIPEKIETTIPETTLPKIIETTTPERIGTTILEKIPQITTIQTIFCSTKEIIQGFCDGELTDEMAEDIYLYITANLINSDALENNRIIKTPNVAFQLSSYDNQKENNEDLNISIVDLGECENKLREEYHISEEYDLLFFKIDIQNPNKTLTYVQYEVYHPETFEELNLEVCQNIVINISVPANLDSETILLYQNLDENGYNLFDLNDAFYNDICTTYTSINNTDVTLQDRKTDIYDNYGNLTICQENCHLESYHNNSKMISCFCDIQSNKTNMDLYIEPNFSIKGISGFLVDYLNNSNFRVMKCYEVAIDLTTISKNIGRIIMSFIVFFFIILFIAFLIKGNKQIHTYIKEIIDRKLKFKNNFRKKNKIKFKKAKTMNIKNKNNITNKILKQNPIKKAKKNIKNNVGNNSAKRIIKTNNVGNERNSRTKMNPSNQFTSSDNKLFFNRINFKKSLFSKPKIKKLKNINNKNNILVYNIFNNINNKRKRKKNIIVNSTDKGKMKSKLENNTIANEIVSLNDQELNTLDYNKAVIYDKRTYFQYYVSLLKKKHLILFTFIPINDYNLTYIKFILFLISFSLYLNINGFFFGDEIIHQIYTNEGKINYLLLIASILYSSLIPSVINTLLRMLALTENTILKIKHQKNLKSIIKFAEECEKDLRIQFIIFFVISFLLLLFFWYFISCFCGVYTNMQITLINETLISFGISMLYPFGLNLIPGIFRIHALRAEKKDKKCLYKIGSFLSLI